MAIAPPRELKVGKIVDKTFAVLEHIALPAAIYAVGLTVVNGVAKYLALDMTPAQQMEIALAQMVIGAILTYFLLDAALRRTGLHSREGGQLILPYLGLYALAALGVVVGLILLILPGLVFAARWSIAQPLLVGRGAGVMDALGESWQRTKGNEVQILVAAFAVLLPLIATLIAAAILLDQESVIGIAIGQLATSAISLVSVATSVALYGMIVGAAARGDA